MYKIDTKEVLGELIYWLDGYAKNIGDGFELYTSFLSLLKEMNSLWKEDDFDPFYQADTISEERNKIYIEIWSQYFHGFLSEIVITNKKTNRRCNIQKIHYDCKRLNDIPEDYFNYLLDGLSKKEIMIKNNVLYPKYRFSLLPNYTKMTRFGNSIFMNENMAIELDMLFELLGIKNHQNYHKYQLSQILNKSSYNERRYERGNYILEVYNSEGYFRDYHFRKYDRLSGELSEYYSRDICGDFKEGLGGALHIDDALERIFLFI